MGAYTWAGNDGLVGYNWSDTHNWSPFGYPSELGDIVHIPEFGFSYDVFHDLTSATISFLEVSQNVTLYFDANPSLSVTPVSGDQAFLNEGTVDLFNSGVSLSATGFTDDGQFFQSAGTFNASSFSGGSVDITGGTFTVAGPNAQFTSGNFEVGGGSVTLAG